MAARPTREQKICYFTLCSGGANRECVRFGLTRRPEAQIVSSREAWLRVRRYLLSDGYDLVEIVDEDAAERRAAVVGA